MSDISLIVPAYNEEEVIEDTLQHLEEADQYVEDIYLVDDASTDTTRDKINNYLQENDTDLHITYMLENGDKVGAIKEAAENVKTDKILLTDADTRLETPENLEDAAEHMDKNNYGGLAFQVIPSETQESSTEKLKQAIHDKSPDKALEAGSVLKDKIYERVQDFDYAMGRALADYTTGEKLRIDPEDKNVRCVAGAGGMYDTEVLQDTLELHSGKHAGDDMETTSVAQLKLDQDIDYFDDIEFETDVPKEYNELVNQRIRWHKGVVQSFSQNPKEHIKEASSLSRYGHTIAYETGLSCFVPAMVAGAGIAAANGDTDTATKMAASAYTFDAAFSGAIGAYSAKKNELRDNNSLALTPFMPFYRASTFYPAKIGSLYEAGKETISQSLDEFKEGINQTENDLESLELNEEILEPSNQTEKPITAD